MKFKISDKEFEKFREKHKDCEFISTTGGKFSFIITPTGLGPVVEVRCNSCDKIEDITDIDNW
jgi:hypothetical protein